MGTDIMQKALYGYEGEGSRKISIDVFKRNKYYKGTNYDGTLILFKVIRFEGDYMEIKVLVDNDSREGAKYPRGLKVLVWNGENAGCYLTNAVEIEQEDLIWEMI